MKQTLFEDSSQRDELRMGRERVPLDAAAMRLIRSTHEEFSIAFETCSHQLYEPDGG
jgi:hypothetical protein